jgi:flavodoxin
MKVAIVFHSSHHGNTKKVVERMAGTMGARLMAPGEAGARVLGEYDLIGFASGIYFSKHHKSLLGLVDSLPPMKGKRVFIVSTAGRGSDWTERNHRALKERLAVKGFDVVGEFACLAWDTFFLLWLIGGINKGRPDDGDLKKAEEFAESLAKSG